MLKALDEAPPLRRSEGLGANPLLALAFANLAPFTSEVAAPARP
jgi:hypothetical protein